MKHILLICALTVGMATSLAAPMQTPIIGESTALNTQSLTELNTAARDQIIRELGLKGDKRKQFEVIYKSYRVALDRAIATPVVADAQDDAAQRRNLKSKLGNIAATARVKDEYVDKFAAVLTAEQIRQLYNAEGAIGTNIKRMAANRPNYNTKLKGSGRMVTQDRGVAGNYTTLLASHTINITVSPTANTIKVTADDNAIDYIQVKNEGGVLSFQIDARSTENVSVSVVVPASSALSKIEASGYSKVTSTMPLKGSLIAIGVSGGASVSADMEGGSATLRVSGYAKYSGSIRVANCIANISGGASAQATINCTDNSSLNVSGYGKFAGTINATTFKGNVSGGGSVDCPVSANDFSLVSSGYGKFRGAMNTKQAQLKCSGGSSIGGTLTCDSFTADVSGYARLSISGSSTATRATASVSSGASFNAPELQVEHYTVTATGYGRANIYCTKTLKINASSGGQVVYDGNAITDVTSSSGTVRHK